MASQEALIIKDSGGTEADVTAANALKVDGSAVTQPVSGTVTATPSGTQNVDVTANTIGLATQATLATIDADTSTLAGAVSGSEMQVDVVGALPTGTNNIGDVDVATIAGIADTGNSSVALLGIGAVFTGAWFDVLNYTSHTITSKSDVASAADGLSFQWSPDGVNADITSGSGINAAEGRGFTITKRGRYFRIVYTNGAVGQASFRLNVHHNNITGLITRPLDATVDDDNYVTGTRAVLVAKRTDGAYGNIRSNNNDRLQITNESVIVDDAAFTPGTSSIGINGYLFDDVAPDSVNEGDGGAGRMSANRNQYTTLRDAAGNERGVNVDASNRLSVSVDNVATGLGVSSALTQRVVEVTSATGTQTSIAGSATNVTLLASNANRLGAMIYNDSTAILYVRLQATATTSNFTVKLFSNDYYEVPFRYTGIIDGIWASATGSASITEIT